MSMSYRKVSSSFFQQNPKQGGLSEEFDSYMDMPQFAIVAPDGTQIGPWMKCKDYIQDVWWGSKHNRDYNCHGFSYSPGDDPKPSKRWLLLAIKWPSKKNKMDNMLVNVKATVENLEKRLKIPKFKRTRFSLVIGDMFIIYGSPQWLTSISLVSFFTWLLRASLNNKKGKLEAIKDSNPPVKKDWYYYTNGLNFINQLLKEGIESFKDDWSYTEVYKCHDGGFVNAAANIGPVEGYMDPELADDDDLDEEDDWF